MIYEIYNIKTKTKTTKMSKEKQEISIRIRKFLKEYAVTVEGEYTSPDAYQLEAAAIILESGKALTTFPWSEWGSGGYKPYTSKKGFKEHEKILELLKSVKE